MSAPTAPAVPPCAPPGLYDWLTQRTPPTAVVRAGDELTCDRCDRLITAGQVVTFRRSDYAAFCPTCVATVRESIRCAGGRRFDFGPDGGDSGSGL